MPGIAERCAVSAHVPACLPASASETWDRHNTV